MDRNNSIPVGGREATGRFAAMSACYFLGTFNDNFFKQAVLILAVSSGLVAYQGYALFAFTLPFVIFASYAGWFADRFSKRRVVISAKWMELAAMVFGAAGIITGHWGMIFSMLLIMGTQATIFSPAINGSIPELYPEEKVVKANGVFRMSIMAAILLGSGLSGFVMDMQGKGPFGIETGRFAVSAVIIGVALFGIITSYFVYSRGPAAPDKPFPWTGPFDTLRVLNKIRKDYFLAVVIICDLFIWFAGSVQILLINPMGLNQFEFSKTKTSLLIVAQLIGIGAGGLLSSKFAKGPRWYRILIPAGFGMALFMMLAFFTTSVPLWLRDPLLFTCVGAVGMFGGLFMIPLESFIQIRPRIEDRGTVIASANFVIFLGLLFSGPFSNFLNKILLPTQSLAALGVFTAVVSILLVIFFRKGELK